MAKKIIIAKFPDKTLQNKMNSELGEMKPEQTSSLMSLMDVLKNGISKARNSGVGWEQIAKYISENTGTTVSADAVCQSFTALERKNKNQGRLDDDISYTQLKCRYNCALKNLKKYGIEEFDVLKSMEDMKKHKEDRKSKQNKKNQTGEINSEQQKKESNDFEVNPIQQNDSETREDLNTREDKELWEEMN